MFMSKSVHGVDTSSLTNLSEVRSSKTKNETAWAPAVQSRDINFKFTNPMLT